MKSLRRKTNIFWNVVRNSTNVFVNTKSFQKVINSLFYDENQLIIESPEYIDYVVMKNSNKFYMSRLINGVTQAQQDYVFDDIRKNDIVIDIGASIGGFSIPASEKAKHVYAVEPMTPIMLNKNIRLNEKTNIDVFGTALGNGAFKEIKWSGESKIIETKTLSEIKKMCDGCDFLKIDCEGCEWDIQPEELEGIRRIEMEVHNIGFPISTMEEKLIKAGFSYKVEHHVGGYIGLWGIHARRKE